MNLQIPLQAKKPQWWHAELNPSNHPERDGEDFAWLLVMTPSKTASDAFSHPSVVKAIILPGSHSWPAPPLSSQWKNDNIPQLPGQHPSWIITMSLHEKQD